MFSDGSFPTDHNGFSALTHQSGQYEIEKTRNINLVQSTEQPTESKEDEYATRYYIRHAPAQSGPLSVISEEEDSAVECISIGSSVQTPKTSNVHSVHIVAERRRKDQSNIMKYTARVGSPPMGTAQSGQNGPTVPGNLKAPQPWSEYESDIGHDRKIGNHNVKQTDHHNYPEIRIERENKPGSENEVVSHTAQNDNQIGSQIENLQNDSRNNGLRQIETQVHDHKEERIGRSIDFLDDSYNGIHIKHVNDNHNNASTDQSNHNEDLREHTNSNNSHNKKDDNNHDNENQEANTIWSKSIVLKNNDNTVDTQPRLWDGSSASSLDLEKGHIRAEAELKNGNLNEKAGSQYPARRRRLLLSIACFLTILLISVVAVVSVLTTRDNNYLPQNTHHPTSAPSKQRSPPESTTLERTPSPSVPSVIDQISESSTPPTSQPVSYDNESDEEMTMATNPTALPTFGDLTTQPEEEEVTSTISPSASLTFAPEALPDAIDTAWTQLGQDIVVTGSDTNTERAFVAMNYEGSILILANSRNLHVYEIDDNEYAWRPHVATNYWSPSGSAINLLEKSSLTSLSCSRNGMTIAVAFANGNVNVYEYSVLWNSWLIKGDQIFLPSSQLTDNDGTAPPMNVSSVSISGEGNIVAVTTMNDEENYFEVRLAEFNDTSQSWNEVVLPFRTYGTFRRVGMELSSDGRVVVVVTESPNRRANIETLRYDRSSSSWYQQTEILNIYEPSIEFSLSGDGNRLAISTTSWSRIYNFVDFISFIGNSWWSPVGIRLPGGSVVALSEDGNRVTIGNSRSQGGPGGVHVYRLDGESGWQQIGTEASIDNDMQVGLVSSISGDGMRIALGSTVTLLDNTNSTRVRVYEQEV